MHKNVIQNKLSHRKYSWIKINLLIVGKRNPSFLEENEP